MNQHSGAATARRSVGLLSDNKDVEQETGCQHLHTIVDEIAPCVASTELANFPDRSPAEQESFVDEAAKRNVLRTAEEITKRSHVIRQAELKDRVLVVGAIYDVKSGSIEFLLE